MTAIPKAPAELPRAHKQFLQNLSERIQDLQGQMAVASTVTAAGRASGVSQTSFNALVSRVQVIETQLGDGMAAGFTLTLTAGETLAAYQVGRIAPDATVRVATIADMLTAPQTIGVILADATAGNSATVVFGGVVENPAWTFTPGEVFLGASGGYSQTRSSGLNVKVGVAITATQVLVSVDVQTASSPVRVLGASWTGAGSPISAPTDNVSVRSPVAGTISKATIITASTTGSCVIDVWKDGFGNYPPTVADSITGTFKPTISGGIKYEDVTLTDWAKALLAGDVLTFHLETASGFSFISIILEISP